MEDRLNIIKERLTKQVDEIMATLRELSDLQSDVLKLVKFYQVDVKAYPGDKIYLLRNPDSWKQIQINDNSLHHSPIDFIDSREITAVNFDKARYDEKVVFHVIYETGYWSNNKYKNEDFGSKVFLTQADALEYFTPIIEKAKAEYVVEQERKKVERAKQLKEELNKLES